MTVSFGSGVPGLWMSPLVVVPTDTAVPDAALLRRVRPAVELCWGGPGE